MKILLAFALMTAAACGGKSNPSPTPTPTPSAGACVKGGCSATLCVDENEPPMATTCEYRDEYACYQAAVCERQADGACGWTPTPELQACLENPPSEMPAGE